ncbi:MAG TPA: hypothetical protein VK973_13320, partial [Arenicellales bacterium]|nr:hypothetical protein [Arenicellales bacterium]
ALFAGPGLSDAIAAGEPGEGEAPAVDEPLLVLGCAVSAGGDAPAPFSLHWRGTGGARYQARRTDTGCSLWGAGGAAMDCPGPADVVVTRGAAPAGPALRCLVSEHDLDDALRRGHERGVDVDDRDCEWLTALSRRMLVAESERSRAAGAGAGLRDND